ncbi:MAG TPA: hypothetical protein VHA56_02205 [Mucilaginibacter sp.]|nr:hypothetical protein [Mucilaginibacter sp.]
MNLPEKMPYQTRSSILFVIFNRPDTTNRVFAAIRDAKPPRLYVSADAPRAGDAEDEILCRQARAIINEVDWDCEVKTLFNTRNLGCRDAVSAAITWFFANEEEGIILEDDCLPANSFFKFCDEMLAYYRHDARVMHITGCNLQQGKKWGEDSYYFSNRVHVWGWASWRRVWEKYDKDLEKYDAGEVAEKFINIYNDELIVESWVQIFKGVKAGQINSWAYSLDFLVFFNNGLVVIPNQNLISNIGFGAGATHTQQEESVYANVQLAEMNNITHPEFILPEKRADLFIMNQDFNVEKRRRKSKSLKGRLKRWFRS